MEVIGYAVTGFLVLLACFIFYLRIRAYRKLIKTARELEDSQQRFGDKLTELGELLERDIKNE